MISITGVGAIITVLEAVSRWLGLELPEGSLSNAVNGVVSVVGLAMVVWGQLRRKDLKMGLVRKVE